MIPHHAAILAFLQKSDPIDLPEGDQHILDDKLFVKVLRYMPQPIKTNDFEIHKEYTDVQVVLKGAELMQVAPLESLTEKGAYEVKTDFQFFYANNFQSNLIVRKSWFAVFFPNEAHRPGGRCFTSSEQNEPVLKLVFKSKS